LESTKSDLPSRLVSNALIYQGSQLALVSKRSGRVLEIRVPPDHARLPEHLAVFREWVGREFNPEGRITVETINRQNALTSPYAPALREAGFRSSGVALELWKGY